MTYVYLATQNQHKVDEIQAFSHQNKSNILFCGLSNLESHLQEQYQPIENGNSFSNNSLIKAKSLFQIIKQPVLAEDSGLVVEDLHGEPGIDSARYASTDKEKIAKVLQKLDKNSKRKAYFITCLCFMQSENHYLFFYGRLNGYIHHQPEGNSGFGYDPIFYEPSHQCTLAQLTIEQKIQIAHRTKALRLFLSYIQFFLLFTSHKEKA